MANSDYATLRISDISDILFQEYMKEFYEVVFRFGRTTNMLVKPSTREVSSDGINIKFEIAMGDSVRFSRSPLGDFARSRAFKPKNLKVRFTDAGGSANDFSEVSGSGTVSQLELMEKGDGAVIDTARRIYTELVEDFGDKLALHRNLPSSARMGLVNGTPTTNASQLFFTSGGAAASNTVGLRVTIDNGPIAAFQPGRRIDFLVPTTGVSRASNVRIVDYNPADKSIGVEFISTGQDQSTGDLSTVADNDEIYLSGERGLGMNSFGAWFTRPASGDSFIGGVSRFDNDNRYLNITATREGASLAKIQKSHFNDLAIAMGYRIEPDQVVAVRSDPEVNQALRDEIGEEAFIEYPTGGERTKRYAHFGSMGMIYQHPHFGVTAFMSDPLILPNTIQVTRPDDWEMLSYGGPEPKFLPGEVGGYWRIMPSDTPGGGDSKFLKCSAFYPGILDMCMCPPAQGTILNVSATGS